MLVLLEIMNLNFITFFIIFGFDRICLSKEIKPRKFDVYY